MPSTGRCRRGSTSCRGEERKDAPQGCEEDHIDKMLKQEFIKKSHLIKEKID
jgi:hypothetical protein